MGEHEFTEAAADGACHRIAVNWATLELGRPLGTRISFELGMRCFVNQPTLTLPW